MENLFIKNDGLKLASTIFYPEIIREKNPAILFIQGWTGERKRSFQYAESLAKLGFICFLVDLRGHGESEGNITDFTQKQFLDDALVAYDYLAGLQGVVPENISAIGSSFGAYIVSLLSSKRKIKNLVLRAPANYPKTTLNKLQKFAGSENPGVTEWRRQKIGPTETYSLGSIHNFGGEILIIESEKDDTIPHQTIENYKNAVKDKAKLTYKILKDAPHSIQTQEFRAMVDKTYSNWFSKFANI